jgi:transaldolase
VTLPFIRAAGRHRGGRHGADPKIRQIYDNYGYQTKVLAASIRHPKHLVECVLAGCDVATVPMSVMRSMLNHPLTDSGLKKFVEDFQEGVRRLIGRHGTLFTHRY